MSGPSSARTSSEGSPLRGPREQRKLGTFFSDKTLSDVIVRFGDQEIFAHRLILVKSPIWFEKALLGEFKESKQTVLDIGNDDDPAAVNAMLRFFYDDKYCLYGLDGSPTNQHLTMYRLADLYDAPDLRKEASRQMIRHIRAELYDIPDQDCLTDPVVLSIQQILGPNAETFADNSIQEDIFKLIVEDASCLYRNELFQKLLSSGSMFSEAFSCRFAGKTGELIKRLQSGANPRSYGWDVPVNEPWSTRWSWETETVW